MVAVAERSFHTISGSWVSVNARASTTSVAVVGVSSTAPATLAMFQVMEEPVVVAVPDPFSGVTSVNAVLGGACTVTCTPRTGVGRLLRTKMRNGYVSPGLTQPVADTNDASSSTGSVGE